MSERDEIEKAATEAVGPLSPQYDAWPRQYVIDFTLAELRKQGEAHKAAQDAAQDQVDLYAAGEAEAKRRSIELERQAEAHKVVLAEFVRFRQDLRQLLFEHGVLSNPGFSDNCIVAGFRQAFARQAEAHRAELKGWIQTANIAEATCYEKDAELADLRAKLAEAQKQKP